MKTIVLFILLFSSFICYSQVGWEIVTSPVTEDFVSVCFADEQQGWILSDQGSLLTTTDGGQTWLTSSLSDGTYTGLCFSDADHGFAVGYNDSSFILKTDDGGATWELVDHPKALRLNDVYFNDVDVGWAVGIYDNKNYQLHTVDGGQNWEPQSSISVLEAELFSVHFRDSQSGNTCGADGIFFSTNNGGDNWALDVSIPSLGEELFCVYNWDMFNGCAVGTSGTALVTTNKWGSYTETNTNTEEALMAVTKSPSSNKLLAVGTNGTILYTQNYLLGWGTQTSGTSEELTDILMISDDLGWAVGKNGTILYYGTGLGMREIKSPYSLAVFPNPTTGPLHCIIRTQIQGNVKFSVSDLRGREIALVSENQLPAGTTSCQLELSFLPDGIYFLRLQTSTGIITQKIIKK